MTISSVEIKSCFDLLAQQFNVYNMYTMLGYSYLFQYCIKVSPSEQDKICKIVIKQNNFNYSRSEWETSTPALKVDGEVPSDRVGGEVRWLSSPRIHCLRRVFGIPRILPPNWTSAYPRFLRLEMSPEIVIIGEEKSINYLL